MAKRINWKFVRVSEKEQAGVFLASSRYESLEPTPFELGVRQTVTMLTAEGKCYCAISSCMSEHRATIDGIERCLAPVFKERMCKECFERSEKEQESIRKRIRSF